MIQSGGRVEIYNYISQMKELKFIEVSIISYRQRLSHVWNPGFLTTLCTNWFSIHKFNVPADPQEVSLTSARLHTHTPPPHTHKIHFFLKFLFIYLFMAVLGLHFCARAFSSCGKWGPLFIAVRGPLTVVASLVAEHRLQTRRLSNCGSRA